MADLYAPQTQFLNTSGGQSEQQASQGITGNADVDAYLSSLPESERNAALERLTAPPTGEELAQMVQGGHNPTLEEFDAIEAWHKNHEVSIVDGIGAGIEQVMGDLGKAVGAVADHPMDVLSKSPANLIEAFSQGTRNFYGMAAQSADPTSKLFRFKNFLNGSGTREERYNQYMEALAFNRESSELMEGKKTLVMDKDMINPEVVQAASYIADPTLFIPFGQAASAGMRAVGLGEKFVLAGAKASAIKNALIGGGLKWGVGAPVEFLGGAVRNTIDFGIEQGARAIETTTGIGAKEIAQTARLSGVPMSAASFAGHSIPYAGAVSEAYVGASAARGIGEAVSAIGETMLKNKAFGRGINSWAKEALENTPNLSSHAKGLLRVLDAVDPMFTYTAAVTQGAAQGAFIGGTLGYLSGGEEGFGHGLGAGIALGAVGGGVGKVVADVTNQTLYSRVAIQRKMTIEGLKALGTSDATQKAMAFEALVKTAEASNDRHYKAHIDGIIAGVDKVAPRSKWYVRNKKQHIEWLLSQQVDPSTGKLFEVAKLFPEFGSDRKARGRALSFLSLVGDQFAGVPDNLIKHLATLPQDHALRKAFFRLSGEQKAAVFEAIKNNADPAFRKSLGETQGVERVSDANYEKWVKDNYEYFDPSNPENNVPELRKQLSVEKDAKRITEINERIKHIEEVKKQYNDWANSTTPETRAKADSAMQDVWKGRASRQMAEPIKPKKATKPKISEYYGDINYGEMQTARVNELFAKGDIEGAKKLIGQFLKDNTNKDGSLNTRGRILRNKLAADGYFDKDGNLRPRRFTENDALPTAGMYEGNEGFVLRRDATGEIEVHINLDNLTKDGVAHELFHAIFKETVLKPDFIDRLSKDLLGTFDKNGVLIKAGSVRKDEVREFLRRYIDLTTDSEKDFKDEMARLESAIKEFEKGGEAKTISPEAIATLHQYTEEFGAYYFQNWLRAQSPDFLFLGGKLTGIRGIMDGIKNGWLDFWERTMKSKDPTFDFASLKESQIDAGFKTKDGKRVRVSSLDYLMRDIVRATSDTNRGNFDINKLSAEGQAHYVESNGLRNTHRVDSNRRAVRLSRREAAKANAIAGKEIYKILKGINPNRAVDGDGNFIGRLSDSELDAVVKSGHVSRAWANKLKMAYEILDGNQSNVIEFGYHGKTEQITDASYPRLYGEDVSFKHRRAILLDVELKVGEKGTFYALFHTLDKSVIEARGDNLWKDSAVQDLWDGNRGAMEQDFFRYLENASKKDGDQSKKESATLWADGKGGQRRDVLHQMLGMAKSEGDTYLNKPIAEIPLGIRHSVTTFNNDGVSSFRVSGTERYNYNHNNAFRLLSRNWKPSEMKSEKIGLGEILTHASGYKFVKDSKGTYKSYDDEGMKIGEYETAEQATKAGESSYKEKIAQKEKAIEREIKAQRKDIAMRKPASEETRRNAILKGDQFDTDEVKAFIDGIDEAYVLRQTRDEHIYQRTDEALADPKALLEFAREKYNKKKPLWEKFDALNEEVKKRYKAKEDFYKEEDNAGVQRLNELIAKYKNDNKALKNSPEYSEYLRLKLDGFKKYTELTDSYLEVSKLKDEFREKYKTELADDGIRNTLNLLIDFEGSTKTDAEKAEQFARIVKENRNGAEYHGLLEELFADDYDDKIQTGVPFVTRTVHGTNNIKLLLSRAFDNRMLAARHGQSTTSSTLGVFSGGSQNTSMFYADRPTPIAQDITIAKAINKFLANEKWNETYNKDGSLTPYGHATDVFNNLLVRFKQNEERHIRELYEGYVRIRENSQKTYEQYFKGGLFTNNEAQDKVSGWGRMLESSGILDKSSAKEKGVHSFVSLEEFIQKKRGTFAEQIMLGKEQKNPWRLSYEKSGALESIAEQIADVIQQSGAYPEMFNLGEAKDVPMQTRQLVRMNNPYVITDPRSYAEYIISPHMLRAKAAGHDGIVFKRFDDGGGRDNIYCVFSEFSDEQIKIMETSFDDDALPLGSDNTGRVLKNGKELGLAMKPREANAPEGGRVYDQQGKQWKTGFIGRQSEENPDLTKDVSLQHIDKANGVNKLVFTDNSTGESKNIGHITWDKFGGISTHIDPEFRGRGLSYLFYSEAAERMRAQGIKQSVSTIVNKDAIPVKIREAIFGDTRRFVSRTEEGKPIGQAEAKAIIAAMQAQGGEYAGVTVSNKIDLNARYKPTEANAPEGGRVYTPEQFKSEFIGKVAAEDPEITEGLRVRATNHLVELVDEKGKTIGKINTWHATEDMISSSGESWIEPSYRGMGYGKLLYSEMMERLRFQGISEFRGEIGDELNRPVKIRESIAGNTMFQVYDKQTGNYRYVGREKLNNPRYEETGTVSNRLDPKAHYKPSEAVMERARKAGYGSTVYYHGTNKQFTEFDSEAGKRASGGGGKAGYFFFTSQEGEAKNYAEMQNNKLSDKLTGVGENTPTTMEVFLKMDNPYDSYEGTRSLTPEQKELVVKYMRENGNYVHKEGMESKARVVVSEKYVQLHHLFKYLDRTQRAEMLSSIGFDGIQDGNHVVVFKPEQIKSAKDFTYDDAGKEIPLSERFDKTKKDIRYKPVGYEGGDDYYKPKKNIFESRDDRGLLVRRIKVGNDELTGDPEARGYQQNPDYVGWEDIGHYPQMGTTAENVWEARNSGLWYWKDDKGIKTKNPMETDNPSFTHAEWFDRSFQYEDDRPTIYGRYEKPKYDKKGNLAEKGRISISSNYRGEIKSMADANFYKETVANTLGVPVDHIDAYLFGANDKVKSQMGYGLKDQLAIKFKPTEGEQGGNKARYDIDEAIVNKLKEKFKGYRNLTAKDMLEFIVENKGQFSPLAERLLESLDKHGLEAFVQQQTSTLGSSQKGTKGWTYHNYNPNNNTVNMLLERNFERRRQYKQNSFEELMMEEILHAVTIEKTPEPMRHGSTIEDTLKTVEHFLRNKEKYTRRFDKDWNQDVGFTENWFTIADAYRQVHKYYASGKFPDGTSIGKQANHGIQYRLSNMGEFIIGITQDGDGVQKILSQIKVPKSEKNLFTKLLDAIKRIWNFDDSIIDSLLAHTSEAVEKEIIREKTWGEKVGTGRFPERAKQYFDGMPKFKPAEAGEQGGRTYKDFQIGGRFIGKYAQENQSIIKDLNIEYFSNDTSDFKDVTDTKWRVALRDKSGNDIGDIAFEYEERGGFFNGTEDVDGLVVSNISVNIRPEHRGKNYQHLLYSEMFERARATGAIGFSQNIENKGGLPLKSVNKIVGKDGSKIWTLRDYEPVSPTQENFDRLMSNAPKMRSGKGLSAEFVQNNGRLDPNAYYKPAEGWRDWQSEKTSIGSVVKNTIGYVILNQGNKFKVYNPSKAMVGIYTDLEQAKRRVQRDEPR